MESVKESRPNVGLKSSDTERNLIGHRTQSDQTPNAIRSDGGRKRQLFSTLRTSLPALFYKKSN